MKYCLHSNDVHPLGLFLLIRSSPGYSASDMLLNDHHMWALAISQLLAKARYGHSYEKPFIVFHSSRADVFLNTLTTALRIFFSFCFI